MAVGSGVEAMALQTKKNGGLIMDEGKPLGRSRALEPTHDLLTSSRMSVRRFATIVEALVLAMLEVGRHRGLCCQIGSKLVFHHDP